MEESFNPGPPYPTAWGIRFLCDCRKQDKEIHIHKGIACDISPHGLHILSDHHICLQKKVAMQLMIPPLTHGAPKEIVKIIGHSIGTVMKEEKFLTEIKFVHFEENGSRELEKHLRQHFDIRFVDSAARGWAQAGGDI